MVTLNKPSAGDTDWTTEINDNWTSLESALSGVNKTLFVATSTATVENTNVDTSLIGSGVGSTTLPADLLTAGKNIRITMRGLLVSTSSTTNNLNIRVKLGGTEIAATGEVDYADDLVNRYWHLVVDITCRSTGTGGSVYCMGHMEYATAASALTVAFAQREIRNTGTDPVNTTISLAVDVSADWATASSTRSINCTNVIIEALN
jgi:hypothetical protein